MRNRWSNFTFWFWNTLFPTVVLLMISVLVIYNAWAIADTLYN